MKKFLIIGNVNAVSYKEVFPLIMDNKIWNGVTLFCGKMPYFKVDKDTDVSTGNHYYDEQGNLYKQVNSICWFTNLDHNKRHRPITLTQTYSSDRHPKYDNYDAIEVSKVCDIPKGYKGVMGVPISFLDKFSPDQFEIIGITENADYLKPFYVEGCKKYDRPYINGKRMYSRILIRFKK